MRSLVLVVSNNYRYGARMDDQGPSNGFALAISSCKLTLFVVIQVYMFKLPRHLKLADIVRRYSGANWFLYMLLF